MKCLSYRGVYNSAKSFTWFITSVSAETDAVRVQPRERVNYRLKVKYKCISLHCNSGVMTRQVLVHRDQANYIFHATC